MRPKSRPLDPYEQLLRGPLPVYSVGPARWWRFWVSVRHRWLDLLIARGVTPGTSPALTLRARQLTSRPIRERLAISIATVLCHSSRKRLTIAPEPVCIEAAAAELQAIEEIVAGECPVYARGVAMTTELLQSPDSPLFDPREAESARDSARRSMTALQGHI